MADLQDKAFINFNFENKLKFEAALKKAGKEVEDLRFPLGEIARDFYKSEQAIFKLKSAGGYPDFKSEKSRMQKIREVGYEYPLLRRTGKLRRSIIGPKAEGSIFILGKKSVVIGTSIKYAAFHNSDEPRGKMPQRKFVFIGPESRQFSGNDQIGGRLVRWVNILEGYVEAVLGNMKT